MIFQSPMKLPLPSSNLRSGFFLRSLTKKLFNSTSSLSTVSTAAASFSSSSAAAVAVENPKDDNLYRRITPLGDPKVSIVPVLEQWVKEGKQVDREQLRHIIKELKFYKRYKHALEISQWMTDRRYIPLTPSDVAARLALIFKVHGLQQAENYFNNIPRQLKSKDVYTALLTCYSQEKLMEKAESIMDIIRDEGIRTPVPYNILMSLYYQLGHWEKLDNLMHEMEESGLFFDQYTYSIRLSAYAAASDSKGIDEIVRRMETDSRIVLDWNAYTVAASSYLKVGFADKAMVMLNRMEKVIPISKKRKFAFDLLLKLYAEMGKKDDVLRVWQLYKRREKINNKGYKSMMIALLKLDDTEATEKIFDEWESKQLFYDFKVPDLLVAAYCTKGLLEKAENIIDRAVSNGGTPSTDTWSLLAGAYLENHQIPKAMEAIKKAISVWKPGCKTNKKTLASCLEYLEGKEDAVGADDFMNSLRAENVFSEAAWETLLDYVRNGKSQSH
ncbi:hypothetical protein Ancab_033831 [Ancistrocladus abbreviatus]